MLSVAPFTLTAAEPDTSPLFHREPLLSILRRLHTQGLEFHVSARLYMGEEKRAQCRSRAAARFEQFQFKLGVGHRRRLLKQDAASPSRTPPRVGQFAACCPHCTPRSR